MLKVTLAKWKQCGLRHARVSMDKTWEARFLGKDSMVLDVWYYYYEYVVYVLYISYMMCAHAVLCIHIMCICCLFNFMYRMVEIGLCEYVICGVVYLLYCLHDVYAVSVHMVLYAFWICSVVYRWCYVHVGYAVLCMDGAM